MDDDLFLRDCLSVHLAKQNNPPLIPLHCTTKTVITLEIIIYTSGGIYI